MVVDKQRQLVSEDGGASSTYCSALTRWWPDAVGLGCSVKVLRCLLSRLEEFSAGCVFVNGELAHTNEVGVNALFGKGLFCDFDGLCECRYVVWIGLSLGGMVKKWKGLIFLIVLHDGCTKVDFFYRSEFELGVPITKYEI